MSKQRMREESPIRSRMGWLLRPYVSRLCLIVLLMIGLTAVNIVVPLMVGMVFDRVFGNGNWSLLWVILGGLLGLYVVRNLLYFFSKYSAVHVGENVAFEVRNRLFERLQQMNLQYYRTNKPGQLSSRVMNDSFVIQTFIQDEMPKLLQASLLFMGIVATIYAMNWQLALAATIVLPLHLAAFHYFKRPIKAASRTAQAHMAEATGNLIEKFLGMEVIKSFTAEQRESQAFEHAIDASRQSQLRSQKFHVSQKVAADLLIGLGTIALIGFGGYQVLTGAMQEGAFIAFFWFIKELYPTVLVLMSGFAKMTKASAGVDRVNEVLQAPTVETSGGTARPQIRGKLAFERVCFRYDDGPPVLHEVSFDVQPGEVCAIVGPSGSGKSTLVNLVPRFHDPDSGDLFIDDFDARDIELRHLRGAIGIAFQECFLFNSTIIENLRYARPEASRGEIIAVAERTGAHEFIMRLPHGYDTMMGENGVTLSRGQKQLINLTRAMLKNPRILILDEATASIDEARESRTIPAILEFMQGKTTLMITHRPEMLKHADKVIHLADGAVASVGPPQESQSMADTPQSEQPEQPEQSEQTEQTESQARLDLDLFDRPAHRHDDDEVDDDRPDARPSGSGIWRGLKVIAVGAMLGCGALMFGAAPSALALADGDGGADGEDTQWSAGEDGEQQENQDNDANAQQEAPAKPQAAAANAAQNENQDAPQDAPQNAQDAQDGGPGGDGQFLPMPDLGSVEMQELLEVISAQARAQFGYRPAPHELAASLPEPPAELQATTALSREVDGTTRLIQLGFQTFVSQPTHLWVYGQAVSDGQVQPNEDVAQMQQLIEQARQARDEVAQQLSANDLKIERMRLSYIEPGRALGILKSMGYQTIEYSAAGQSAGKDEIINPSGQIDPENLPAVAAVPGSKAVDLVGPTGTNGGRGDFNLSTNLNVASELTESTSSSRQMELLIFYHPARPEQYSDVIERVRQSIDLPAKQILIEAMVLEISTTGLEKLGVDWELTTPFGGTHTNNIEDLQAGRLPNFVSQDDEQPTFDIIAEDVFGNFRVELEALVREGEAEVLSRPSVLTLDNRQASLRVGEEIPIATSFDIGGGGDNVKLDFSYIPVGIMLNVRPRTSARSEEVSLQIDGIVSAQVPGEDLVVRDNDGDELGRAPRISTRRVQTYARVGNNTPFIIGGLISKNNTQQTDKVPILGDIPIIKHAFRSTEIDTLKREVIIVLTPYILPENQTVGRNMPKDEDAFDSFGNELFRDAYRIRAEDVFDLSFLVQNPQLRRLQRLADAVVNANRDLEDEYPFNKFAEGRIPGERILVFRQMYEVIIRKNIGTQVRNGQIIYFHPDNASESGFSVGFIDQVVEDYANKAWAQAHPDVAPRHGPSDPFEKLRSVDKAIAMTYIVRDRAVNGNEILQQPVAHVRLVDCASGGEWSRLLWQLNQPDEQGRTRYTILLREQENLTRIKRALVLKRTVELNATEGSLTLNNFTVGRQLLMPTVKEQKMYLIDADAAKYFFFTEQYYPALQRQLQQDIESLKEALQQGKYSRYLTDPANFEQDNAPAPGAPAPPQAADQ